MTIVQGLIASIGGAGTPAQFVGSEWAFDGNDTSRGFAGANGWWTSSVNSGGLNTYSTFSNPAPAWNTITYEDNTTGHTYDFTGTQWMASSALQDTGKINTWLNNTASIDMWFYPTSNNVSIISLTNTVNTISGYHATLLEINSIGNLVGRWWPHGSDPSKPPGLTSSNAVTLNAWNHAYLRIDQGLLFMSLNGQGQFGSTPTDFSGPGQTSTYVVIGQEDTTCVAASAPFQGKIGRIVIRDDVGGSSWTTLRSKYVAWANTYTSGTPPVEGTNATWGTSTIVGSHQTWPPGTPGPSHGAVLANGAYVDVPAELKKGSWTVEIVAELNPQSFWATVFGNESFNDSTGYVAYFGNGGVSEFNVGRPGAVNTYDLTGLTGSRSYWAFVNDGNTITLYCNGTVVNPASTGFSQPTLGGPNSIYFAARHLNNGTGYTDTCYMTLYKYIISDTALNGTAITASYASLYDTYGLPTP